MNRVLSFLFGRVNNCVTLASNMYCRLCCFNNVLPVLVFLMF